jgi:arsenical pump membrane protein
MHRRAEPLHLRYLRILSTTGPGPTLVAGARRALPTVVLPGALIGAAVLVVVTGALPMSDASDVLRRIRPVLAFLLAVTVVAELADAAGLFERAADLAARAGRGRVAALWLLVVLLATGTTTVLSLDTTAVLLTPVVLALAARLELPAWPFALVTIWLANTASLLLPVSNLTNLLAVERIGWTAAGWAGRMWAPAVVAVVVTTATAWLLFGRQLRGRYVPPDVRPTRHRGLLVTATAVCAGLGIAVSLGAPPWLAAGVGALVLVTAFGLVDRQVLGLRLVPVRLAIGTVAIFLLVAAAERFGLSTLLHRAVAPPGMAPATPLDLLRTAGVGTASSNVLNNLPAYLAVEPAVAADPPRLLALVIGTNAGPLVTPWGSLATLLWIDRCRARGLPVSPWRLAGYGALPAVPVVALPTVTLAWLH